MAELTNCLKFVCQAITNPGAVHKLGEALFVKVGEVLQAHGLKLGTGTIVDATIIGAPSSTKNPDKQRDPEMHPTREVRYRGLAKNGTRALVATALANIFLARKRLAA